MIKANDHSDIYTVGKKGLVEFRSVFVTVEGDEGSPEFHKEWSDDLLNPHDTLPHCAFEGYRESGKSSLILRGFPNYKFVYPDPACDYIVLIKANKDQARKGMKNIKDEFMSNPLIKVNLVEVVKNTSDVFSVVLRDPFNNRLVPVLIEAYGKGAAIRGLNNRDIRPKVILIDDIQDTKDMLGEKVPDDDWDWFLSDVMFLGKKARIFMIGNNLGERCIIERVGRNAESLGFKFKRFPIANDALTVSNWPEKDPIEAIKKERDDYERVGKLDVWLRERMCVAVSDELRIFREDMYKSYTPALRDKLADTGTVYAALDPASSKQRNACFRAIVVGALMPDGQWYILDVRYGRWDSIELMDNMFDVVKLWGVRDFGVEKGQYQQFLEPVLYREMTLRNCRFSINPLDHGKIGGKLDRIKMMQPYFKSGSVWFPDQATWLAELKSELAGVTRDELKSEFVDLIDALAMLVEQMRQFSTMTARQIADPSKLQRTAIT